MKFKEYWSSYPKKFEETELARQVQYTVKGKPIAETYIDDIAEGIVLSLEITNRDRVLDLCCGNGMFTTKLAPRCREIVGVDFSDSLIAIAKKLNAGDTIVYIEKDAVDYVRSVAPADRYDKIVVNGAFQYFARRQGRALIEGMAGALRPGGRILLSGVLDARRKSGLYDTPAKQLRHLWRRLTGREMIGVWWTTDAIRSIAAGAGLSCSFKDSRGQTAAPFRFDAILSLTKPG